MNTNFTFFGVKMPKQFAEQLARELAVRDGDNVVGEHNYLTDSYTFTNRSCKPPLSMSIDARTLQLLMDKPPRAAKAIEALDAFRVYADSAKEAWGGIDFARETAITKTYQRYSRANSGKSTFSSIPPIEATEFKDVMDELADMDKPANTFTGSNKPASFQKPVLVIAGTYAEAEEFVKDILGVDSWKYVDKFEVMMRHKSSSVYIVGTARQRKDFGAIEGLFIAGGHEVLDMETDE